MVTSGCYYPRPGFTVGFSGYSGAGFNTPTDIKQQTMVQHGAVESLPARIERTNNGAAVLDAIRAIVIGGSVDHKLPTDAVNTSAATLIASLSTGPLATRVNTMTGTSPTSTVPADVTARLAAGRALLQLLVDVDFSSYALTPLASCPIDSAHCGLWMDLSNRVLFRNIGGSTDFVSQA